MEVIHRRCSGLDVHKETVVACVRLVLDDKITREVRTFETTTSGLLLLLAWLTEIGCTHVAMEATGVYWKSVWNILSDGDFELVLANAAHIKNVPGRKTDVSDAAWIADLLAHGLIRSSFIPEQELQEMRDLLRTRKQLGRHQSSHIKRLQKTLESANVKLDSVITDIVGKSGRAMIQALIAGETDPVKLAALADRRRQRNGGVSAMRKNATPGVRARRGMFCLHLRRQSNPKAPFCVLKVFAPDAVRTAVDRVQASIGPSIWKTNGWNGTRAEASCPRRCDAGKRNVARVVPEQQQLCYSRSQKGTGMSHVKNAARLGALRKTVEQMNRTVCAT